MDNYCMIEIAFDNKKEVDTAIKGLLDKKLVSSCQVLNSDSTWNWHDEREKSKEYILFVKTKRVFAKEIFEYIKIIHSYDCFEFAIFNLESCNTDYLKWIDEETSNEQW